MITFLLLLLAEFIFFLTLYKKAKNYNNIAYIPYEEYYKTSVRCMLGMLYSNQQLENTRKQLNTQSKF